MHRCLVKFSDSLEAANVLPPPVPAAPPHSAGSAPTTPSTPAYAAALLEAAVEKHMRPLLGEAAVAAAAGLEERDSSGEDSDCSAPTASVYTNSGGSAAAVVAASVSAHVSHVQGTVSIPPRQARKHVIAGAGKRNGLRGEADKERSLFSWAKPQRRRTKDGGGVSRGRRGISVGESKGGHSEDERTNARIQDEQEQQRRAQAWAARIAARRLGAVPPPLVPAVASTDGGRNEEPSTPSDGVNEGTLGTGHDVDSGTDDYRGSPEVDLS